VSTKDPITQHAPPPASGPIRLLVVDDSAYNRRNIASVFAGNSDVEVVGKAADGEEALRLATVLRPDVITLDLEMPRMDGFTFLRILMSRQPTPVIVVSSYSQKENVFKALELGALDFVAKPDRQLAPDAVGVRDEILSKVMMVRSLRPALPGATMRRTASGAWTEAGRPASIEGASGAIKREPPKTVVAIASSTGGPSALLQLFGKVPLGSMTAFLIAQHMPDKFTRTFAERLDRRGPTRVSEAQEGDYVVASSGFVCPGRQCMEVYSSSQGELRLRVVAAVPSDRYVPSADRLLTSLANAMGPRAVGLILTGMGEDGVEGAKAIRARGGIVVAESAESAVVNGMPGAVVRSGAASKVMSLAQIGDWIGTLPLQS
jgi:two-component system, chemotaxis family, protein-glutamate methylesterase/glutaminase